MKQISKAAILMLIIMFILGAANAIAGEPLFLTESKKALLFKVDGLGAVTLRGKRAGVEGTITCDKSTGDGFVLDKSPLSREINIEFSGKCEQESLGNKEKCTEPIKPMKLYGELGLLSGHVYVLFAPESGTEFFEYKCTNGNTKLQGAVIGEFKLGGRGGGNQYSTEQEDFLLLYKAKGTTQEPEEIELLGVRMTGVSLRWEGFFSGKGSLESVQLLLVDGNALIDP